MAGWISLTRWTWVWVNSRSWWWIGRPGVLRFMGSQRVGHNWVTELNLTELWEKLVTETNIQCLSKAVICLPINSLTVDPHILHFHFIMVKWWEPVKVDYKCPLYYLSFRFSMDLLALISLCWDLTRLWFPTISWWCGFVKKPVVLSYFKNHLVMRLYNSFYQEIGIPDHLPASGEICIQVKKQQLELDMEQQTGSK